MSPSKGLPIYRGDIVYQIFGRLVGVNLIQVKSSQSGGRALQRAVVGRQVVEVAGRTECSDNNSENIKTYAHCEITTNTIIVLPE